MRGIRRTGRSLLAALLALSFMLPLYWMLVASLRQPGLPPATTVEWWPAAAHWQNYQQVFQTVPFGRYLTNSTLVVALAVPLAWLTSTLAGFTLAQLPPGRQRFYLLLSVALMMIPGAAVWLFRYQILRWLGLIDSLWALILPAMAANNPLFVLLFYWSYRRIPAGVIESARLDGAGVWRAWWSLGRPLVRPASIGVVVLSFAGYWGDFISPVLYVYRTKLYTLAVGLQLLKQLDATNWPILMAAAVIMTIPVVGVFFALQRFFLTDLSLANLLDKN